MKRRLVLILILLLISVAGYAQSLKGKTMYVSVKSAPVKSSSGFFADTKGTLSYGDSVTVTQEKDKWVEIKATKSALTGWTASANLTTKRITASGGASASADELALAGKGFSAEVEKSYRQGSDLDYADIDAMEKLNVPDGTLRSFITEGRLSAGGN